MLLLSFSPSDALPPILPTAAVSLLINFSLLTRAQSCSSPQPASETALRSALPLPRSYSSSSLLVQHLASKQCWRYAYTVTLPWGMDLRLDQFLLCKSHLGYLLCHSIRLTGVKWYAGVSACLQIQIACTKIRLFSSITQTMEWIISFIFRCLDPQIRNNCIHLTSRVNFDLLYLQKLCTHSVFLYKDQLLQVFWVCSHTVLPPGEAVEIIWLL